MSRLDKIRAGGAEKKCFGHVQGYTLSGSDNFFIKLNSDHPGSDGSDGYILSIQRREAIKLFRRLEQYVAEQIPMGD